MPDEQNEAAAEAEGEERVDLDLDDLTFEPSGDPVLERGLEMSLGQIDEVRADPAHPDHEAAVAAHEHIMESLRGVLPDPLAQVRRIFGNLDAASKVDLDNLFDPPKVHRFAKAVADTPRPGLELPDLGEITTLADLAEHLTSMIRVSAEHRDVAIQQRDAFREDAKAARESAAATIKSQGQTLFWTRISVGLTMLAVAGTWVAILVSG